MAVPLKRRAEKYSPLYCLASLGAGGRTVTFFICLMVWVPETGQVPVFEAIAAQTISARSLWQTLTLCPTVAKHHTTREHPMIAHLAIFLGCQLAGEVIARGASLPVPGPVLGLALLLAACIAWPDLGRRLLPTAQGLLAHLSLLFVPAGVGVVAHLGSLGSAAPALLAALVGSTVLALAAGALTFAGLARLTGSAGGRDD